MRGGRKLAPRFLARNRKPTHLFMATHTETPTDHIHTPHNLSHTHSLSSTQVQLQRLDESTRALLRQHLEASTSEFAMNLMASLPEVSYYPQGVAGGCEEEGQDEDNMAEDAVRACMCLCVYQ